MAHTKSFITCRPILSASREKWEVTLITRTSDKSNILRGPWDFELSKFDCILITFCLSCKLIVPNEKRNKLSKTQQVDSETVVWPRNGACSVVPLSRELEFGNESLSIHITCAEVCCA